MKIKEGFILRTVGDTSIVVAVGAASKDFNGLITLNGSGVFLWKKLTEGASEDELIKAMLDKYDIDEVTAKKDIGDFISKAQGAGLLE